MGSGHSKEDSKKESKKESKRSSRHASSRHSTSRPSSSRTKAHDSSSKPKRCSSSKCKSGSKSSKGGSSSSSSKDPCADLTPEALQALRKDFLSKLGDPKFVTQKHIIWGRLTTRQQKKCQMLQATFYDISDEEMRRFRDEWRREYPEDMDYGYDAQEDALYAQQGQPPQNALGIFQNAPNDAEDGGMGRAKKRQTELLPALPIIPATPHARPANPPPVPITPAVRGMMPEDYAQIREDLRKGGNKSSSSKPSSAEPSSSRHSSHRHSSHRHSSSKHGSSKHSSSKSGKSSSHHHKSSSSRH
ncbi:hypothetical protein V8C35DRAFT_163799 [Trichoderma chlorosporum]